jgi:hypothetical protein
MLPKRSLWERWSPGSGSEHSGAHVETSGSKVYDLVLGPMDGQVHLVAHLEEAAGRLRVI